MLIWALAAMPAQAQDEPTIVMEEDVDAPMRWGSTVTGRTQVQWWAVTGTRTTPDGSEAVDEAYLALEVGNGFRFTYLVERGISVGGEVGWGGVPGTLGGTAGPPFSLGVDVGPVIGLGSDAVHAEQSPVGVVVGAGVRLDLLYLTGLGSSGRDPIVFVPRPFAAAEVFVHIPPFMVGVRGEYVLPGRTRFQSFDTTTELRIGRWGGGVVFNLPF